MLGDLCTPAVHFSPSVRPGGPASGGVRPGGPASGGVRPGGPASGGVGRLLDRDDAALAAAVELHDARRLGEDRVVLADADTVTRMEAGAALAHDDLAAGHGLTGEHLDAEPLCVRVAAISG